MDLDKIMRGLERTLMFCALGVVGYFLYTHSDFSNVRSQKHQRTTITRQVQDKNGEKYALLVGAGKEDRFRKNIKFGYESLLRAGFPPENVFVLTSHEDVGGRVKGKANRKDLMATLEGLQEKVTSDDMFFLYITGHGTEEYLFFGESEIDLRGRNITSSEFWEEYQKINPNYSIAVFKQCYGGGFANKFGNYNHIGISASKKNKVSWGDDWDNKDGFSIQLFEALGGMNVEGESVNSDSNQDGKVSIEEIFDYAVNNNSHTKPRWFGLEKQTPKMFWQNADPSRLYIR